MNFHSVENKGKFGKFKFLKTQRNFEKYLKVKDIQKEKVLFTYLHLWIAING